MLIVKTIAVKVPPVIPLHSPLQQVLEKVQVLASQYGCKVMLLTRDDLKRHAQLHHTDSLLEYAVLQYPVLRPQYLKEKASTTHYYTKLFEAVVAAEVCKVSLGK